MLQSLPPALAMYGPLSPGQSMCLFVALLGFDACERGQTIRRIVPFQQHLTAGQREASEAWGEGLRGCGAEGCEMRGCLQRGTGGSSAVMQISVHFWVQPWVQFPAQQHWGGTAAPSSGSCGRSAVGNHMGSAGIVCNFPSEIPSFPDPPLSPPGLLHFQEQNSPPPQSRTDGVPGARIPETPLWGGGGRLGAHRGAQSVCAPRTPRPLPRLRTMVPGWGQQPRVGVGCGVGAAAVPGAAGPSPPPPARCTADAFRPDLHGRNHGNHCSAAASQRGWGRRAERGREGENGDGVVAL